MKTTDEALDKVLSFKQFSLLSAINVDGTSDKLQDIFVGVDENTIRVRVKNLRLKGLVQPKQIDGKYALTEKGLDYLEENNFFYKHVFEGMGWKVKVWTPDKQ